MMLYSLSNIAEEKLAEIQQIEADIGKPLLAFSPVAANPARLDREKLRQIQYLEKELGVVLVAVDEEAA